MATKRGRSVLEMGGFLTPIGVSVLGGYLNLRPGQIKAPKLTGQSLAPSASGESLGPALTGAISSPITTGTGLLAPALTGTLED